MYSDNIFSAIKAFFQITILTGDVGIRMWYLNKKDQERLAEFLSEISGRSKDEFLKRPSGSLISKPLIVKKAN